MKIAMTLSIMAACAASASAGIGVETYGTAAPPATVRGGIMRPAPFRTDLFADVMSTAGSSVGHVVTFSTPVSVRAIGTGWASWSHGYTGNAFYTNGATTLTMTIDRGAAAFQFYAEPNPFGVFNITARGIDSLGNPISSTQAVEGSAGASGWGFYGTGGAAVESVTVSSDVDFAVGEFAASIPAPAGAAAFALTALATSRRRR